MRSMTISAKSPNVRVQNAGSRHAEHDLLAPHRGRTRQVPTDASNSSARFNSHSPESEALACSVAGSEAINCPWQWGHKIERPRYSNRTWRFLPQIGQA